MLHVIIFLIKFLARLNLFSYIQLKHGQTTLAIVRRFEQMKYRIVKIDGDICFIKKCIKESLSPTFARTSVHLKGDNVKLKDKLRKVILNTELNNKNTEKRRLMKSFKQLQGQLQGVLSFLEFSALLYRLTLYTSSRNKVTAERHECKLSKLRSQKSKETVNKCNDFIKQVVHNFSDYELTAEERIALSFGLDQHIPTKINHNSLKIEFENFYQDIVRNISPLTDDTRELLKTKLRHSYDQYSRIKVPFKHRQTVENLRKRDSIIVMKQDKGRGVVILNKTTYIDKCIEFLNGEQFHKDNEDKTKLIEGKVQRALRKIKKHLPDKTYKTLYPTGSNLGKFYGLAKIHKLKQSEGVEQLPIRPIISNLGTATYQTAKFLSKLLLPLTKSEYTIESTKHFIELIGNKKIPAGYELVSFDVKSLFTNVPLETTINIILKRIYNNNEIKTSIPRKDMKELLLLCTKSVQFTFDNMFFSQTDGVAMGSPLGPVLANIFMVELEQSLVPEMNNLMDFWYRYVDDTICLVKEGELENILEKLNTFHQSIEFTYKQERNYMLSF